MSITLALLTVAVRAEGLKKPAVDKLVNDYGLADQGPGFLKRSVPIRT